MHLSFYICQSEDFNGLLNIITSLSFLQIRKWEKGRHRAFGVAEYLPSSQERGKDPFLLFRAT